MCRFVAWLGRPLTLEQLLLDPPFGLLRQSYAPRRQRFGTINADGFGVGWYSPQRSRPARYRVSAPLWSDESFASVAGVVESGCVLAGVRSASVGMPVEVTATAPFTAGQYLFGHNGFVPDIDALRRLLPPGTLPESRVDSALLWTMVQARLADGAAPAEALADVVRTVTATTPGRLNLFLTDGQQLAATAWGDTLWVREDADGLLIASEPDDEANGAAAVVRDTVTDRAGSADQAAPTDRGASHDRTGRTEAAVPAVGASGPLRGAAGSWRELPDQTVLTVRQGRLTTADLA